MLKPSTGETRDLYQKPASPLSDKYYFCGKGGFFIIIYFSSNILKYQRLYSKKEICFSNLLCKDPRNDRLMFCVVYFVEFHLFPERKVLSQ